jgi:hypothetical protein
LRPEDAKQALLIDLKANGVAMNAWDFGSQSFILFSFFNCSELETDI